MSLGSSSERPRSVMRKGVAERSYVSFIEVELRPGTWIVTGRNARGLSYDWEAVIVNAWETGGDPDKFEDWEYEILMPPALNDSHRDWYGPYAISLDGVGFALRAPEPLIQLPQPLRELVIASYPIIQALDNELLAYSLSHADALERISPNQLEELAVGICRNHGFHVERFGRWHQADSDVDLLAVQRTFSAGTLRLATQCKHSRNKVSAEPIRSLMGVLDHYNAHKGVVMTSSTFTKDAVVEGRSYFWRIELKDRAAIMEALQSIFHR